MLYHLYVKWTSYTNISHPELISYSISLYCIYDWWNYITRKIKVLNIKILYSSYFLNHFVCVWKLFNKLPIMFLLLKYPNKHYTNIYIIKKYDLPKNDFFQFSGSIYPTHFSLPRNTNNASSISGIAFFITSNL